MKKLSSDAERVFELSPVYAFETSIARITSQLRSDFSSKGMRIGAYDLIIGSTARSLGFSVAIYSIRLFERIEELKK